MSNLSQLDNIEMAIVKNPIINKDSSNTIPNRHHELHHHTTNAPPPRRRRRVSLARAFVGNKVNSIGMKLRRFKENHPGIVSIILTVHAIGKLLIFFVDIISDTTLVFEISNNDAVQDYFYTMLFFLLLQYLFGMIGLNVYFKKDLYQNPPARLKVGDQVEARKPHWGYDRHQPGNIIKINDDDNTYDIEFYAWSYEKRGSVVEDRIITRVKQLEIKDYDQLPKTFYTNKDLNIIRMNNFKRFIGFLLSPILVIVFDVLMLIYRPLQKYLNPEIIPFIIQYDAQRTLVEVCVESVPQSIIQLFLYFLQRHTIVSVCLMLKWCMWISRSTCIFKYTKYRNHFVNCIFHFHFTINNNGVHHHSSNGDNFKAIYPSFIGIREWFKFRCNQCK